MSRRNRPCHCPRPNCGCKEIIYPVKQNVVNTCSEETVKHVHPSHTTVVNHHLVKNEHIFPHSTSFENTFNQVDVYGGSFNVPTPGPGGQVGGAMTPGMGMQPPGQVGGAMTPGMGMQPPGQFGGAMNPGMGMNQGKPPFGSMPNQGGMGSGMKPGMCHGPKPTNWC